MTQAEIVRRAVDEYIEREQAKEDKKLFTSETWLKIQEIADTLEITPIAVIRQALQEKISRFFKRRNS